MGAYISPNPQNQTNATYQGEVNDLKNWVAGRLGWMDWAITGHCPFIGIEENITDNQVFVYPNPVHSQATFEIKLTKDADVSLKITDILGREITLLANEHKTSGELKIPFDRKQIPAGIYFYRLNINNAMKSGKLILQ